MAALILRGHSTIKTAHLLTQLSRQSQRALVASKDARLYAKDAQSQSRAADAQTKRAMLAVSRAEGAARTAEYHAEQANIEALGASVRAGTAEAGLDAQRRALRTLNVQIALRGPLPTNYKGGISSVGEDRSVPSVFMYAIGNGDAKQVRLSLGGKQEEFSDAGAWVVNYSTELINEGYPVGEDIRGLSAYKSVCVDVTAALAGLGIQMRPINALEMPMDVELKIEVNGISMHSDEFFNEMYASSHRLADGNEAYCVDMRASLDSIFEASQ